MAESVALLVDEVLPYVPMRQWVLSVPFPLRFLFATNPAVLTEALGIIVRVLTTHLLKKAGHSHTTAHTGAVTLIQRFGSSLNLNIHFHRLALDGVYVNPTRQARPALHRGMVARSRRVRKKEGSGMREVLERRFMLPIPRCACEAIIALSCNLNVKVVADGVETDEQRKFLAARGCDELQGYLYARPAPASVIGPLLKTGRADG